MPHEPTDKDAALPSACDAAGTSDTTALVVWSNTGRRVYFAKHDLQMPERVRQLPHAHFYAKQWDAVAGHWYNRVLKQSSLQHLSIDDIVRCIERDIDKRWQARKAEHAAHKRRKRLLARDGAAGTPSPRILLTNVVALDEFVAMSADEKTELVDVIVRRVEAVTRHTVRGVDVLVDVDDTAAAAAPSSPKRARVDTPPSPPVGDDATAARAHAASVDATTHTRDPDVSTMTTMTTMTTTATMSSLSSAPVAATSAFDDHVAVVCTLPSVDVAANAVARLHGARFDGRHVLCRFAPA